LFFSIAYLAGFVDFLFRQVSIGGGAKVSVYDLGKPIFAFSAVSSEFFARNRRVVFVS
jgi:hypothetical protein